MKSRDAYLHSPKAVNWYSASDALLNYAKCITHGRRPEPHPLVLLCVHARKDAPVRRHDEVNWS